MNSVVERMVYSIRHVPMDLVNRKALQEEFVFVVAAVVVFDRMDHPVVVQTSSDCLQKGIIDEKYVFRKLRRKTHSYILVAEAVAVLDQAYEHHDRLEKVMDN